LALRRLYQILFISGHYHTWPREVLIVIDLGIWSLHLILRHSALALISYFIIHVVPGDFFKLVLILWLVINFLKVIIIVN
jgi:hypothetical protein